VVSGGLLGARFPRLFAWPLAALGAAFGGLGVLRAARSALSGCATLREWDNSEWGEQ
jgi:hypothetical protein